ncbi:hypothetical protein ACX80T_06525 [Arthrobacter sp. Sr33]|nr:hypothetical protein [Arthrobacter sp. TB 23]
MGVFLSRRGWDAGAWPLTSFAAARTRDDSLPAARQRAAKTP